MCWESHPFFSMRTTWSVVKPLVINNWLFGSTAVNLVVGSLPGRRWPRPVKGTVVQIGEAHDPKKPPQLTAINFNFKGSMFSLKGGLPSASHLHGHRKTTLFAMETKNRTLDQHPPTGVSW